MSLNNMRRSELYDRGVINSIVKYVCFIRSDHASTKDHFIIFKE